MKKRKLLAALLSAFILICIVLIIIFLPFSSLRDPFHIICMGDSLTESEFGYYPKHLLGLLKQKGIRVKVHTAARPGNTSGEYLDFVKSSRLLKHLPMDMAILMLGTNDVRIDRDSTPLSRYIQNMKAIIQEIKGCSSSGGITPVIFLATIPPIFEIDLHTFGDISRDRVSEEINPAIRKMSIEEGINLLDVNLFFNNHPELLPGIHPTRRGYYALARFIFDQILEFLEKR